MNIKTVEAFFITPLGLKARVDTDTAKVYDYNNKEGWVEYNARCINEDNKPKDTWINYRVAGQLTTVEDRLNTWSNVFKTLIGFKMNELNYSQAVKKQTRKEVIKWVKSHEDEVFTKSGDFKKRLKKVANQCIKDIGLKEAVN